MTTCNLISEVLRMDEERRTTGYTGKACDAKVGRLADAAPVLARALQEALELLDDVLPMTGEDADRIDAFLDKHNPLPTVDK